jgi:hypothetical protein
MRPVFLNLSPEAKKIFEILVYVDLDSVPHAFFQEVSVEGNDDWSQLHFIGRSYQVLGDS